MSGDSAADGRAPLPAGGGSSAPQNPPKKSLGPPGKAPNLERRAIIRPHSFREWDKSESVLDLQGLAKLLPEIDGERAQKLIQCSTNRLIETLQKINPDFKYEAALNPRRILTNPAAGVGNGGMDNQNADLIIAVNDIIVNQSVSGTCKRYRVVDTLGQGTFGQVIKCEDLSSKELRAIKIIKNKPAYTNQALIEVKILHVLNDVYDPHDKCHIVRIHEHFYFKNHLCIATELLNANLYEFLKQNHYRGLPWDLIKTFCRQILKTLRVLREARLIHCDLKPENILLMNQNSADVKVIDFGSACFEDQTVYTYIQSRFYRSPEVLIGNPYNSSIDTWSVGCIAAELYLGLPLFPGINEFDQICRIVEMLGIPPMSMLKMGKNTSKYFVSQSDEDGANFSFRLKSRDEFAKETNTTAITSKRYFRGCTLNEVIFKYSYSKELNVKEKKQERQMRKCFHDFLKGLLCLDPLSRRTPEQALQHPFLTGAELELPYNGDKLLPQRHSIPSGNVSVLSASLAKTSIKDELKSNPGAYAGISVGSGNYFNSAHTHTGAFSTSLGSHVVGLHGPVFSNLQKPLSHSGGHRSNNSGDYADQMRRSSSFIRIPINSDSQTSLDHVSVSIENSPSRLTSTYQHSLGSDSSNSHRKNIISKNITISKEVRSSPNDSEFYRRATLPNRAQQKQASQFQHAGSYSKHYVRSGFSHGHAQSFNRAAAFPSIWSPDVSDLSPSQPSFSEVISIPDHSPYNRNFMFFDRSVFPPPLANPSEWYGNGNSSSNSSGQPSNTTLIGADELTHDIEHNSVSEDSFTVNMESADAEWDPFFHSGTPHSLEPKSSVLAKASHSSGNGRHPSNQKR